MNQPPLNPDALRRAADAVSELYTDGHCPKAEDAAEVAVSAYLATALPEVTNVEELDQLPSGSIVRASGGSAWKKFGSGWGAWFKAGDSLDYEASIVALPARVLYRPSKERRDGRE